MKLSEMKAAGEVLAEQLKDPEFRKEWERTAVARAVATRVVAYRAKQGLTQVELGLRLGMGQSAVARLESGEHEPSVTTLARLSRALGIEFHIDITPDALSIRA